MRPLTPKYTITDMQELAAFNGGRCLSKEYWAINTKLAWRCEKGHTWDLSPRYVRQGSWCPQCAKAERQSFFFEELQQIAKKRGGKCLSKKYITNNTKLKWQCKEGHTWNTIPSIVKAKHWCPVCARKIESVKRRNTIEQMRKIAQSRGGKCLSTKYINGHTKLKWQCKEGHTWNSTPENVKAKHWCPVCATKSTADKLRGTIEQMREIAENRGGKCLSKKYVDQITKLKWQCKEGHIWKTIPANVKNGNHWCPVCGLKKGADKLRGNIEEMQKIAESKGGKCLSKEYINSCIKLKWQCKKGHIWESMPTSVKHKNSWCPVCKRKQ